MSDPCPHPSSSRTTTEGAIGATYPARVTFCHECREVIEAYIRNPWGEDVAYSE